MKKYIGILGFVSMWMVPFVTFAQGKDLNYIFSLITTYLQKALLLMMGFAVLMFVYYVIKFFLRPVDDRKEGANYLMWSVIGFFVILSFWGIVNVLQSTFDLGDNKPASWGEFFNIFPTKSS